MLFVEGSSLQVESRGEQFHRYEIRARGNGPASKGQLQFDLWNRKPKSGRWDWTALKAKIAKHGLHNSLLIAPMPTASTAQILGNNESFEPYTQNLYVRRVLSGEFARGIRGLCGIRVTSSAS